ncbi:hypothetical protein IMCC3317_42850 [Kordia antarctica]|uniref:DUF2723 domain-containing protein n=1 Tax=Kordia antarctica TaxID=1218801 RepID=A0A7L4ZQG3_9FLAO|nr:DUF2723 domain-containing protein [Kordia antarctica]QHI38885.1 hypothetical protein IMCC3317_42850 [Kordia antarctica]
MPKAKKISSWMLFAFVFLMYSISASKTITFWDSPEFIASNHTLQASHPPGAPFYTILCKVILSFFSASKAAWITNLISSFFGAVTITLLFRITTNIADRVLSVSKSNHATTIALLAGIVSALTLAFSDSFWTASTEAEVYTLSFALMTAMIHVMLLWEHTSDRKREIILLLLFALLLGFSTGTHLINIAIVIPMSILIAHKKFGLTVKSFFIAILLGCISFFVIYGFVVQGIIKLANNLDIWLVNSFKTSLNTGISVLLISIFIIFSVLLVYSRKREKIILHHTILGFIFFLIGMSSFLMPMQRSEIHTLVTESMRNSNKMLQYVRAEQFGIGEIPLLKGPVYSAPLDKDVGFVDGKPVFTYDIDTKKYVTVDDGKFKEVNYAAEFTTFFPRMFDKGDSNKYNAWTTITGEAINYPVKGEMTKIMKPTFAENLGFFWNYQVMWMNARYLFWNFIGRQNDHQGVGFIKDGNWISGINALDKSRIGDKSVIPERYKNHKGNDAFYFLPFILGLLGIFALRKHKAYFWTTILLFLTFGLGITIYVNPVPSSILIRERDYIFIGSFVIFSLWVGLSVIALFQFTKFIANQKIRVAIIGIIAFLASPAQLFSKGWDNHQRSHDNFAYNFGKAYLDACPQQAVLITNGDNMTFPIWYLQQVEGYRTDVRVINFDQLNIETHIDNLQRKMYDSKPLKITLKRDVYISGIEKLFPLQEEIKKAANLPVLFNFLNDKTTRIQWNGRLRHYIPSTSFSIPIDTLTIQKTPNPTTLNGSYTPTITWNYPKDFYGLNEIVLMNLLTNNIQNRPICFAINGKRGHTIGLDSYLIQHGMVNILAPIQRKNSKLNPKIVDTKMMYPYIMNQLQFEGFRDENEFLRYENKSYAQNILRQNYYFLAQALLEEGNVEKSMEVLDNCTSLFPNRTVPYKQFAFAIGKLYIRAGNVEKGTEICKTAMQNIWGELQWMTSFDPPNAVINLRHAFRLKNMYAQMMSQFPSGIENAPISQETFQNFEADFLKWQQRNWPY